MPRRPRRVPAALAAGTLLLVCLPAALASATIGTPTDGLPPGIGIRLLDVPVEDADDPRANDYIVDHVNAGAVLERRVLVSNGSDAPLSVTMGGARATATDGWVVDEQGAPAAHELAAWIRSTPDEFVLAPQSVTEVTVTITVPGDAPTGEQYAVVVAEPPAVDGGGGVGIISRVGLRVYLSVAGADATTQDEPVTDFAIDTLRAFRDDDGVPGVEVGVTNTGGRAVDVGGQLLLTSEDGLLTAGPFPTVIPATLGPGASGSVDVMLDPDLPRGPWVARATLRSGLVERIAEATVHFPQFAGESEDAVRAQRIEAQKRVLIPTALILLLLAIAGLWFLLLLARRDREDEEEQHGTPASTTIVERPPQ